jgi:hypothetical protein
MQIDERNQSYIIIMKWEEETRDKSLADDLVRQFHICLLFRAWVMLTSLGVQGNSYEFTLRKMRERLSHLYQMYVLRYDRAVVDMVGRWPPTAVARVRSKVRSVGIFAG